MTVFGTRVETQLAGLDGATGWLNSEPLTPEGLRGEVVLVQFWTYTCINWLRTLAYIRAWAERYKDHGLVVVGVHTPEFPFERDVENIIEAVRDMRIEYPVAIDSDYAIWTAFANHYWPALYLVDAEGRIRHHHFGEGAYDESERVLQQLLEEAGARELGSDLVSVTPEGVEVQADWDSLRSPETYLGYGHSEHLDASEPRRLNDWTLSGDWSMGEQAAVLDAAPGGIAFRFHARDLHLVMGPAARGTSIPFRVSLDGQPPNGANGLDVDEDGNGELTKQRMYQLIRQRGPITDRTFEITFLAPGVEAYAFTFG